MTAIYSHALSRPLGPEVLADALADVTGVADRYGDLPDGTRAVALVDPAVPSESLDILGRCSRQSPATSRRHGGRPRGEAPPDQRPADQPQDRRPRTAGSHRRSLRDFPTDA